MKTELDLRRSTTASKTASAPTSFCAGSRCSSPGRRDHHRRNLHQLGNTSTTAHRTFTGPACTYRQRTELTKPQRDILAKLDLTPPKKIIDLAANPLTTRASASQPRAHRRVTTSVRHRGSGVPGLRGSRPPGPAGSATRTPRPTSTRREDPAHLMAPSRNDIRNDIQTVACRSGADPFTPIPGSATAHPPAARPLARRHPAPRPTTVGGRPHQRRDHHRLRGTECDTRYLAQQYCTTAPPLRARRLSAGSAHTAMRLSRSATSSTNTPPHQHAPDQRKHTRLDTLAPPVVRSPIPAGSTPRFRVQTHHTAAERKSSRRTQTSRPPTPTCPAPCGTLLTPDRPAGHCLQLNAPRRLPNGIQTLLFS